MQTPECVEQRCPSDKTPALPVRDQGVWRAALVLAALFFWAGGWVYPGLSVGLAQGLWAPQAQGSMIMKEGQVLGSALVAQPFNSASYFQARPSAAGPQGYDPMALSGSNLARTHPDLLARLAQARAAVAQREGVDVQQVPSDAFTQSGSGIDPHISPAWAQLQIQRVARARGWSRETVEQLVNQHTEGPQWGFLGGPRVHVLRLNLALDARDARSESGS